MFVLTVSWYKLRLGAGAESARRRVFCLLNYILKDKSCNSITYVKDVILKSPKLYDFLEFKDLNFSDLEDPIPDLV